MKVLFNNSYGKFTHYDFCVTEVTAEVEPHEYKEALEQGFLLSHNVWRQCRSTRINLSKTAYTSNVDARILTKYNIAELNRVCDAYIENRNYVLSPFDVEITEIDTILGYYFKEKLIAWTKIRNYNGIKEAAFFVWDGTHTNLKMITATLEHEIAWAKSLGDKYLYIGAGYETCSLYKSEVHGFEWWTGQQWSTDVDEYVALCRRDTKVNDFTKYQDLIYNAIL